MSATLYDRIRDAPIPQFRVGGVDMCFFGSRRIAFPDTDDVAGFLSASINVTIVNTVQRLPYEWLMCMRGVRFFGRCAAGGNTNTTHHRLHAPPWHWKNQPLYDYIP